jgi:plastocyanin
MRNRKAGIVAVVAVSAALAASVALVAGSSAATTNHSAGAHARAKTERVTVADDYYAPDNLKIKPKTKVKWKWDPLNLNTHNVVLKKAPRKVDKKDFKSASGSIGISFKKKFKTPGSYDFVCTFHKTVMKMTVKVKKKR